MAEWNHQLLMGGHTGRLLKSLCFTSMTFLLLHIIYQITINSLLAGDNIKPNFNCSSWERSIRQLGFESVRGADAGNGIRVFIPDIGMFVVGLVTWLLCRSLEKPLLKDVSQHNSDFEVDDQVRKPYVRGADAGNGIRVFIPDIGMFVVGLVTWLLCRSLEKPLLKDVSQHNSDFEVDDQCFSSSIDAKTERHGMMLPSLTSTVYFFTFLGLCTWWSFCRTFDPLLFSCLCVLMAIFSAGHLIMLYLYQFQFFQEAVPPGNIYASLFGISPVVQTDCSHTWMFRVNPDLEWHHFVNPIMLLVLYYTLATLIRLWLQESEDMVREKEGETEEREEPESPESNMADYTAEKKRQLWRMAHYRTDERHVGAPFHSLVMHRYSGVKNLFGISPVVQTDCSHTWMFRVNPDLEWHHFVNPIMLLVLYYTLATLIRLWLQESEDMIDTQKIDCGVYKIDSTYVELPEVPRPFGVVRVNAAVKAFRFIMKQSYICALIAMMAWSITYVSWLTFVFLIWSCILWMVRDRRKYSMITSPFMVFYGNLLIILQYIWSFESLQPVPGLFLKKEVPFRELGSKTLCLLSFWLLLRQFLTERRERQTDETQLSDVKVEGHTTEGLEDEASGHREMMDVLGRTVMAMLNKYWIYICGGMFFFVSFEGRIVMYKIIYMMMFLFCVALYQLHYERWRWMLKYFWMSVVVYTMLVLILVYTFQFESSISVWSNMTGMSREKLEDLGLEKFSVPALFTRIFIPTSFLLVCILHLHYFHERFLELTDIKSVADKQKSTISRLVHLEGSLADISTIKPSLDSVNEEETEERVDLEEEEDDVKQREEEEVSEPHFSCSMTADPEPDRGSELKNKWRLVVERLTVLFLKFLECVQKLQLFIWWLLELHIIKIVSSYIIWLSVREVSLFNYVFLVSWAFALPFSQFRPLASSVCTVWTCVIVVCKMLYQLTSINPSSYSRSCSMPENYTDAQRSDMARSLLYSGPVDPANWIGFRKFSPLLENLRNNLLMLALLAFEVTIYRHQDFYRMKNNLTPPVTRTVFHNITRQHLDHGIVNCAKYFIDYFFYKFGLETCFLLAVNVIGQRMDFYAMLHAFGLIVVMYQSRRKAIARVWSKYCFFLACMLAFQYLMCIGIPPAACTDYPWRRPSSSMDSNVIKWLYFPDFHTKPSSLFLLYDFMLLLCASIQGRVFEEENVAAVQLLAGDNVEICRDLDAASFSQHNPVPDFIHCRSYLDMLKVIVFSYLFWFVLTIIFITGTTRISIFCMGYLVACFYFLIFGGELLLKPIKSILHYWDFLIAYNVFVITMKNILSIAACGYIKALVANHCWLIQLFSLACTIKGYSKPEQNANKQCELPSDEAGIIWDSICFAFLLLQRRVFMSYYFLHVVADIRSSQVLASRGAELFQATIVKVVKARIEEEKKSMDLLKRQYQTANCWLPAWKSRISEVTLFLKQSVLPALLKDWNRVQVYPLHVDRTQCTELYSRQGTSDTVEEAVSQRELREHPDKLWSSTSDLRTPLRAEQVCWTQGEADIPPSYSKATGLDSVCDAEGRRLRIQTPEEKSADVLLSMSHQLTASELLRSRTFYDEELEASEHFYRSQPQLLQLCYALYSMLVAHSQMVCYLVIILNHMISASVATLVLPILIFLWAMLSVPRPSKRFWMTAIVYTEVTIVIKYFFQFGFFPFNQSIKLDKSKPFHPPNIIGVEKKEGYVHYDLIQLLALFFHRSILKCYGLWDEDEPRSGGQTASSHSDSEEKDASPVSTHIRLPRKPLRQSSSVSQRSARSKPGALRYTLLLVHSDICYGLWDEDEPRSGGQTASSHSDSEEKDASPVSTHIRLPRKPLRQSSSVSQRSARSKPVSKALRVPDLGSGCVSAGSSGSRTSVRSLSAQLKSRKELILDKLREQLIKAKRFTVKTWAFGKHSAAADITSSLSEDQVPEAFLVMVLIQFGTMVVDRALYLRKTVMGKVIFQVILVFGIHFWMFFILPGVTERRFSQNTVAQLWYFVKCIYFGLSAYQIRCGYPTRVLGNFLTKSYNYLNLFLFQGFRLVPFLTELRAVMDWVWTDTTLSLSSWICVEDIYAHIFVLKCWRESEKRYPQPRGQKKKKVVKYGMGGMIVMLLICIVWFPLLFMSLVKSVAGVVNKPLDVSLTITLGGFQPIFTMSAQQNQLKDVTDRDFISFMNSYRHNSSALQFLEAYTAEDVTVAELEGSSNSLWTISPPSRKNLMDVLSKEDQFPVTMSWSIQRNLSLGAKAEFAVDKHITYLDMNTRQELIALLNGTRNKPVVIEQVFPCFIRAPSDSNAKPVGQLYSDEGYKSIQLDLERSHNGTEDIQEWWIVDQPSAGKTQMRSESKLEKKREAGLQLYVFSDKVSPPSLGFLAGYGIMGLYASVVLVIGKFVREFFSGISHSIMFEELPCVDRILKLCTDIFLVRETGELELEEDLYAKLIFLYRSPETMIKWTREKTK
ncbi:piezo-type mechanosensitive ion channel component 2-like [Sinocyclocheilus grahami]|uniref:piezo-type mechanosensitive ion channel component 2-like n=1 Tax=Sinocyclocheilus grahami TaxID=75366 RepID=UPI0007AD0BCE|nr:PREDICTED: piezo-type mechanosensitive ion channel component 2-like [Sinocyclocheilus grahami]